MDAFYLSNLIVVAVITVALVVMLYARRRKIATRRLETLERAARAPVPRDVAEQYTERGQGLTPWHSTAAVLSLVVMAALSVNREPGSAAPLFGWALTLTSVGLLGSFQTLWRTRPPRTSTRSAVLVPRVANDYLHPATLWLQRLALVLPVTMIGIALWTWTDGSAEVVHPGRVLSVGVFALLVGLISVAFTQIALRQAAPTETVDEGFWRGVLTSEFLTNTSAIGSATCGWAAFAPIIPSVGGSGNSVLFAVSLAGVLVVIASAVVGLKTGGADVPWFLRRYRHPEHQA